MTLTKPKSKRPTATHRKRTGQHHNTQGHHYVKAYWPYLPVFAVLLFGVVLNSWIGRAHHSVLGYSTNVSSRQLLLDTNAERNKDNESVLHINAQLTAAAQAKANDMAKRDYWSHITPDGRQPGSFVDASGYEYQSIGENLAYGFGTSDDTITAWMHSSEHRANILNANYKDVGFATANVASYLNQGPQTIIVALYAQPSVVTTAAAPVTSNPQTIQLTNQAQTVSRVQLSNNSIWLQLLLAALCGGAIVIFFARHAIAWHKVLVRGEQFALAHPFFDTFLISLAVLTFLLSHAAGTIL